MIEAPETSRPTMCVDDTRKEITVQLARLDFDELVDFLRNRVPANYSDYGVIVLFDGLPHRAEFERNGDGRVSRLVLGTPTEERVRHCNESAVAVLKAVRTLGFDAVEYGDLAGLHCPNLHRVPDRDMSLLFMVFDDEPLRSEFAARWEQQAAIRGLVERTSLVPADLLFVSADRFREAGWLCVEPHLRLSAEGVLYLASDSVTKYELRTWTGA